MNRYSKLKIIIPSDDYSEFVEIGGPEGMRRKAIAELSKYLGMEVHIRVPGDSHRALLLNSAPTDFPELRKHIGTLKNSWDVTLCVPNDDSSTTDRASITGGTHEVEDALELLRLRSELPILPAFTDSGAVQSTSGIDKVIIFHDGENCHCGGNIDANKIYKGFIEAIKNILGYCPGVGIKRVVWKMYITNGKNVPPMYHPSEATQSHLRNMGVDTVTAGEKQGDVDTRLMKGVGDFFADTHESNGAGTTTILFVICSGDSDFSQQLRSAKEMGFRTMIAHGGTLAHLKPGYDTHADFVWSGWAKLRDSARLDGHLPVVTSTPHVSHVPTTPTTAFKSEPTWHVDIPMNHKFFGRIIMNIKKLQSDYGITLHTRDKKIIRTEHPLPISGAAHNVQRCMVKLGVLVSLKKTLHVIPTERERFEAALRGLQPHYDPPTNSSYHLSPLTHGPAPITIPCKFAHSVFFLKYQKNMILDTPCFKYDDSISVKYHSVKYAHSYIELQCTSNETLVELERCVVEALAEQHTEQFALVLPVRESLASITEKYSVILSADADTGTCSSPLSLASADVRALALQSQHVKYEVMSRLQVFTLVGSTMFGSTMFGSQIDLVKLDLFKEEEVAIAPFGGNSHCDEAAYLRNDEVQRTIQDRFSVKVRVQKERGLSESGSTKDIAPNNALDPQLNKFVRQLHSWLSKQHPPEVTATRLTPFYKEEHISYETREAVKVFGGLKKLVSNQTSLSAEDTRSSHFLIRLAPTTVSSSKAHTQRRTTRGGTVNGSAPSPELENFAKKLQSWLYKQPSREVLSIKLQQFYKENPMLEDTRSHALKAFGGVKALVRATPGLLSAQDIDGDGNNSYWIRPVSSAVATTVTTTVAPTIAPTVAPTFAPTVTPIVAALQNNLQIVGSPKDVSRAFQFLLSVTAVPVADCTLAADQSSVDRVRSLWEFFHEYTKDYDGDLPDPVILHMQLNGKQLSGANWGEASAGGSLTCRLLCCVALDDSGATKGFCDGVVSEWKRVALTYTTKEFPLSGTLAKEAKDKRWCDELKRNHNLINVFLKETSKFAETPEKLWQINISHRHPLLRKMIGSKFSNITRLHEEFSVTFPTLSGGRRNESNQPIQIRGKADDVRKCMADLTTTFSSHSSALEIDVIAAEKQAFAAELDETVPLMLSGSADTVDAAIQALQELALGNEQSIVSVAWPNIFGWLKDDPRFRDQTNKVTRFCESVGVKCKHYPTPHTLVRLNGRKQAVAKCENQFQELIETTRKDIVSTPFELTKKEFVFVTANKYDVFNYSLKKARTCQFYVGYQRDDPSDGHYRVNTVTLLSLDPDGIKWVMDEIKKYMQAQVDLPDHSIVNTGWKSPVATSSASSCDSLTPDRPLSTASGTNVDHNVQRAQPGTQLFVKVITSTSKNGCQKIAQSLHREHTNVVKAKSTSIDIDANSFGSQYDLSLDLENVAQNTDNRPLLIHFCGHGEVVRGLVFGDKNVNIDKLVKRIVECKPDAVIINACSQAELGKQLGDHDILVLCWRGKVDTEKCELLSKIVYDALLYKLSTSMSKASVGHDLVKAFNLGIDEVDDSNLLLFPLRFDERPTSGYINNVSDRAISDVDVDSDGPYYLWPEITERGSPAWKFKPKKQDPPDGGPLTRSSAEKFLERCHAAKDAKELPFLFADSVYFYGPTPSREYYFQIDREVYAWLVDTDNKDGGDGGDDGTKEPTAPPFSQPRQFQKDSDVPYIILHVHFLSKGDKPEEALLPDFERISGLNIRWSHAWPQTVHTTCSDTQKDFLRRYAGNDLTGRLSNPCTIPIDGSRPVVHSKEHDGGGGLNLTGKHKCSNKLGSEWRYTRCYSFNTDLPQNEICQVFVQDCEISEHNGTRCLKFVSKQYTMELPDKQILKGKYLILHPEPIHEKYWSEKLGWKYKSDPLPTFDRIGLQKPQIAAPGTKLERGLNACLDYAEAARADLLRKYKQGSVDYAACKDSRPIWGANRRFKLAESKLDFQNRSNTSEE